MYKVLSATISASLLLASPLTLADRADRAAQLQQSQARVQQSQQNIQQQRMQQQQSLEALKPGDRPAYTAPTTRPAPVAQEPIDYSSPSNPQQQQWDQQPQQQPQDRGFATPPPAQQQQDGGGFNYGF